MIKTRKLKLVLLLLTKMQMFFQFSTIVLSLSQGVTQNPIYVLFLFHLLQSVSVPTGSRTFQLELKETHKSSHTWHFVMHNSFSGDGTLDFTRSPSFVVCFLFVGWLVTVITVTKKMWPCPQVLLFFSRRVHRIRLPLFTSWNAESNTVSVLRA